MAGWTAGSPRDQLDRLSGLQVFHNGETRQQLFYQYDDAGRLATVESPRIGARYDYLPGTRLVRQLAVSDPLGPVAYDTRSYDQDHRLDRRIVHNGSLDSGFHAFADYGIERDPLGRIESATIGDGTGWDYRYHPSGALAEANRSREGAVLPGHRFRWSYDPRGNLLETSRRDAPASPTTFQANQLDQFTAIQRPAGFPFSARHRSPPRCCGVCVLFGAITFPTSSRATSIRYRLLVSGYVSIGSSNQGSRCTPFTIPARMRGSWAGFQVSVPKHFANPPGSPI